MTKAIWRGKGSFCLTLPGRSPSLREARAGTQGRNVEAGTEADTTKEHRLLAHSSWLSLLLVYITEDHLPRRGIAHSELGPPTSVTNPEKFPTGLLTR